MSKENLKLWDSVSETDPTYTKKVNARGGFTSIDSQYQIMNATEQFGSYGAAWGFKSIDLDYSLLDTGLVVFKGVFFFPGGEFPIINCIALGTKKIDDDFAKKLETSTLSKALSKLGFNADIFLGKFEDFDYVRAAATKAEIKKVEDQDEAIEREMANIEEWVMKEIETYRMIPLASAIRPVYDSHLKKARLKCAAINVNPEAIIKRFRAAGEKRKEELEKITKENSNESN